MDRSNDSNSSGVRLMYFSGCLRVNPLVAYLSWNRAYDSPTKATDSSTKVFCNEKLSILHGALDATIHAASARSLTTLHRSFTRCRCLSFIPELGSGPDWSAIARSATSHANTEYLEA